jgi:hypothetical protein
MFPAYSVFQNADRFIQLIQTNAKAVFDKVLGSQILDGGLVTATFGTANTDVTVNHNLGRPVIAWFPGGGLGDPSQKPPVPAGPAAAASIFLSGTQNKTPNSTIIFQASAPCTVSIWFC